MVPLEFRGTTYLLPPLTQDDMDALEPFCAARALAKVRALAPHQTRAENAADYEATLLRVNAGFFAFGEPACEAALWTDAGLAHACWLALRRQHPEVTAELVKAMVKEKGSAWLSHHYRLANPDPTSPGAGSGGASSGHNSANGSASAPPKSAGSPTATSATTT